MIRVDFAAQLVLQHREIRGAIDGRRHQLAVDDRAAGVDQIGVGRDFAKASGPIIAASGENLDRIIVDMELDAIAIELDLMDPAVAGRHLLDRRRQRGLDETGEGRLRADHRRFFALKRHAQRLRLNKLDLQYYGSYSFLNCCCSSAREHSEETRILPSSSDVKQREDERGNQ